MSPIEVPENKIIQLPVNIKMPDDPSLFNSVHAEELDRRFGFLTPSTELNNKEIVFLYNKIVLHGKITNSIFEAYLKFKGIKNPEIKREIKKIVIRPKPFPRKDIGDIPDFKKLAGNDNDEEKLELVVNPNKPNQWENRYPSN